ncbi:MAG: HAMP domain-containing sensor histidine kinase [Elusimicrobiales bacterium]|nr:HAMP domain-containing sensor histidine kinase [Elusimicrobiales bacterium]
MTGPDHRLKFIIFGAAALPAGILYVCAAALGLEMRYSLGIAAAAGAVCAFAAGSAVMSGLVRPVSNAAAFIKRVVAGGYKMEAPLAKEGWPEAEELISAVNRVLLELNAYRSFHINQLVEERAKAEALLETITDGVLLTDDRGRLIHSNRCALEWLAVAEGKEAVLPDSAGRVEFRAALGRIFASPEPLAREEVSLGGEGEDGGAARNFRLVSRQFSLATLKRPGRVITIRDITMEKEIESARETFFHMITHDMRAPICSIQGYTELMRKQTGVPPGSEKCLDAIMRSSERLKGMVEDILNLIKLERGEMTLKSVGIDGGALCRRMLDLHQPLAARRNIALSALPPEGPLLFTGDLTLLERVVANLLGNALEFTPAGGKVTLSCRALDGDAVFSVEDSGPGVPEEMREEIFRKHCQLEEHKHMGFGLGLAMCRLAVELHGGDIRVGPGAGKGAVFTFNIPLKGPEDA